MSFIDYNTHYVRCGSKQTRNDNSCVRYGDETYIPNDPNKYTSHSVRVDRVGDCENRCGSKEDCVAYSYSQNGDCALAGVDFEGGDFGGVNIIKQGSNDTWTTKIKTLHDVPLHVPAQY